MSTTITLAALLVSSLSPTALRCESQTDPVGVATAVPRLSWKLAAIAGGRNLRQTGYRVLVASDRRLLREGRADLWDSGLVRSDDTYNIEYLGRPLRSNEGCWWTVQVVDQDGKPSSWSKPAKWSTGLLQASDWQAEWIGFDAPRLQAEKADAFVGAKWIWSGDAPSVSFRKNLEVGQGLRKATLTMTADDRFSLTVGGKVLAQTEAVNNGWQRSVVVDLTRALASGSNALEVKADNADGAGGLIGVVELQYSDGRTEKIVTDASWQTVDGEPAKEVGAYGAAPWGTFNQSLTLPPARYLRHEFTLAKPVRRATLYSTALGLVDLHLNGKKVGNDYFNPGWTAYEKRVYATAYDVTKSVKEGDNAIGIVLGDGWYSGYVGFGGRRDHYGKNLRAKVQLMIEYSDRSREIIASSPAWKASTGPIEFSDFLMGETYDAQKELDGWDLPGYNARTWKKVDLGTEEEEVNVEPFVGQPVRAYAVLKPKRVTEPSKGVYLLDLGQNMAGFARMKVQGKKGQKIVLRFGERLNPDGTLYTTNLRSARATDTYTCRGDGVETWEPRFTFHGFQYIEVSGLDRKPGRDEVVGIALSSDTPTVGKIETSDPMLNKLVSNAWWTQRMNFIDVPTDCPQRDERLGWTGDAQAYIRTAAMLADVQPFFDKWLLTLNDSQRADGQYPQVAPVKVAGDDGGPAWADAGVICPWEVYNVYGDKRVLARQYDGMKRFVEFCRERSGEDLLPPKSFHCFGDWLNIGANTPNEIIYQAYFAGSARLLSKAAKVLGKTEDVAQYDALYQAVRQAFQKAYVQPDGTIHGDTQCAYTLALAFDLLDESQVKIAADRLVADIEKRGGHLSTGFVGTRDIMHVLSKIGRNDVAFRLLHNKTFPSWGFTIVNGATSIWERWDGWTPEKGFQDPGMNSFAHYAFGAVVGWMMAQPAGIDNLEPGFRTVKIAPQIDPNLKWLKSSYDSIRGTIVSEWKVDGDRLTMRVVVPPNVQAEVHVPDGRIEKVGSGEYTFTSRIAR